MVKVILQPGLRELRGKMGGWTYRRMYGKQTIMKTPDTPALARRCKCVQGQVEQGSESSPSALQAGSGLCADGHG
jgi:hypothetical protein